MSITPQLRWMRATLAAAAAYNICFGLLTIVSAERSLSWLGVAESTPREQALWQCIGMIVGVYGIAYAIASRNPLKHWPVVFAGLLGKLFGPIGFCVSASRGVLPWRMGTIIAFNDLIWWIPFAAILYAANKHWRVYRNQNEY